MAQIEIENLIFTYAGADKAAVKNISLKINEGDFIVVCGKSGCGKSTLLRSMKPAIRPFGKAEGKVLYEGKDIDEIGEREQAESIGFVMQNPEHQIVTDKVWHELAFGPESLGMKPEEIRLRVAEMSEYFGIGGWYFESVDKLSGGQKQLLNLAAVMAMHPKIMILDEPTAQLDPIAAESFLDTLNKINKDLGITIVLSEHRLNQVLDYADKVLVMQEGKAILCDTPKNTVSLIKDRELLKLMPVPSQLFQICRGHGEIPLSVSEGRKWINSLELESKEERENFFKTSCDNIEREIALECKNLWFRYERSGADIINGLNLKIEKGEVFAILGGNGCGKTTTMSLLSQINKPYRGKLNVNGKISALPQNVQTLFHKETVREEVCNVPNKIIEKLELSKLLDRHPYDLSGGEQQRLALSKVLAANPDILLLDEPTKGIDSIYKEKLGGILEQLKSEGKTIVIVSHDVDFCGEFADRCGLFANGSIIAVNNYRDFFSGNRFYTTTVNKMAASKIKSAVRKEDIIQCQK